MIVARIPLIRPAHLFLPFDGRQARRLILSGRKTLTVRFGQFPDWLSAEPGRLFFVGCHLLNWCRKAQVISTTLKTIGALTDEEITADGHQRRRELLSSLQRIYGNVFPGVRINATTQVTIIRFRLVP
jgi:hypothetical protein